ncbi:MAG: Holliday junction DNA helicase RuvB C-terminal domain-containing protein [Planctomycetota bacterium]
MILRHRSHALEWAVDDSVLPEIAQRSRGTPRLALRMLQSCRRVCRSEGNRKITTEHLERACLLEQIDGLGLGPTEQQYLDIMTEGPCRLNVIASLLGLPSRTVSQITEPILIRLGLISKDDQGRRELTVQGREHLSNRG